MREFLREHNRTQRTTILLTSHYMADIEALCKRVVIINRGTMFFDGGLDEVVDRYASSKLITLELKPGAVLPPGGLADLGKVLDHSDGRLRLKVPRDQVIPACKALLDRLPVADMDIEDIDIEDIVRNIFVRGDQIGVSGDTTFHFQRVA